METILDTLRALPQNDPLLELTLGSLVSKEACKIQINHVPTYLDAQSWYFLRGYSLCSARADELYLEMMTWMTREKWGEAVPLIQEFLRMDSQAQEFEHKFHSHPLIQAQRSWHESKDYEYDLSVLEERVYMTLSLFAQERCADRPDILQAIRSPRDDPDTYHQYVSSLAAFVATLFGSEK